MERIHQNDKEEYRKTKSAYRTILKEIHYKNPELLDCYITLNSIDGSIAEVS